MKKNIGRDFPLSPTPDPGDSKKQRQSKRAEKEAKKKQSDTFNKMFLAKEIDRYKGMDKPAMTKYKKAAEKAVSSAAKSSAEEYYLKALGKNLYNK